MASSTTFQCLTTAMFIKATHHDDKGHLKPPEKINVIHQATESRESGVSAMIFKDKHLKKIIIIK